MSFSKATDLPKDCIRQILAYCETSPDFINSVLALSSKKSVHDIIGRQGKINFNLTYNEINDTFSFTLEEVNNLLNIDFLTSVNFCIDEKVLKQKHLGNFSQTEIKIMNNLIDTLQRVVFPLCISRQLLFTGRINISFFGLSDHFESMIRYKEFDSLIDCTLITYYHFLKEAIDASSYLSHQNLSFQINSFDVDLEKKSAFLWKDKIYLYNYPLVNVQYMIENKLKFIMKRLPEVKIIEYHEDSLDDIAKSGANICLERKFDDSFHHTIYFDLLSEWNIFTIQDYFDRTKKLSNEKIFIKSGFIFIDIFSVYKNTFINRMIRRKNIVFESDVIEIFIMIPDSYKISRQLSKDILNFLYDIQENSNTEKIYVILGLYNSPILSDNINIGTNSKLINEDIVNLCEQIGEDNFVNAYYFPDKIECFKPTFGFLQNILTKLESFTNEFEPNFQNSSRKEKDCDDLAEIEFISLQHFTKKIFSSHPKSKRYF